MCNLQPNSKIGFTVLLSILVAGCGIKWATNKVLSNPDAIAKVGAVYDQLTPRDTTERLVFIPGDSIVMELHDTTRIKSVDTLATADTIRINITKTVRRIDTLRITLPADNRAIARLNDTISHYKTITDRLSGEAIQYKAQAKTAEKRLIWMAAVLLLAGVVIGVLVRFKLIPKL